MNETPGVQPSTDVSRSSTESLEQREQLTLSQSYPHSNRSGYAIDTAIRSIHNGEFDARDRHNNLTPDSTTPLPHSHQLPSSPTMVAHSYSARASSLSYQNIPQHRSLDGRKEGRIEEDSSEDYTSDEQDQKKAWSYYSDLKHPHDLEDPFSNPKGISPRYSYPFPRDRPSGPTRPLISLVRNEWQQRKARRSRSPSPAEDDICPEGWNEILCSRTFRRWMVIYLILMVVAWVWWFNYYGPKYVEQSLLKESLNARRESKQGHFGMNRRVTFAGLTQLKQLHRRLVPGSEIEGAEKRRLVIVGDIHGCLEEFESLLDRTKFDAHRDHLIATGDAINKGPSSSAVLDALIRLNASSVRGNHEDKILHAHRDYRAPSHQKFISSSDSDSSAEAAPIDIKHGAARDLELAASLTEDQVRYLTSWPLILSVGPIPGMGNVSVVHAGLTPGLPLLHQDPVSVMNMRSIDLRNHVPSSRHAPVPGVDPPNAKDYDHRGRAAIKPWTVLWNAWQEMLPKDEQQTVVYGHDSKKGVVQGTWSIGLDGGCVSGGKLAALVIEEIGTGEVKKEIISVPCKNYAAEKILRPLGEN